MPSRGWTHDRTATPDETPVEAPVFIIGAGFNVDAVREAGPIFGDSIYIGRHQIRCGYPVVGDLARLCFGLESPPVDRSIEDLFQEAAERRDREPVRRLANELSKADYYLSHALIFENEGNSYAAFFRQFHRSHFLSFNYDALVELFLMSHQAWFPTDGYGVPAEVGVIVGHEDWRERRSSSKVLHLHGSLCLFSSLFDVRAGDRPGHAHLEMREQPRYHFDPHSIGHCFTPFERAPLPLGFERPEERIIAPAPSKSTGLVHEFIQAGFAHARRLLESSRDPVVSIGYSFNEHDRESYDPLLSALRSNRSPKLAVVSPQAEQIRDRLSSDYPGVEVLAEPYTFSEWVAAGYPGAT